MRLFITSNTFHVSFLMISTLCLLEASVLSVILNRFPHSCPYLNLSCLCGRPSHSTTHKPHPPTLYLLSSYVCACRTPASPSHRFSSLTTCSTVLTCLLSPRLPTAITRRDWGSSVSLSHAFTSHCIRKWLIFLSVWPIKLCSLYGQTIYLNSVSPKPWAGSLEVYSHSIRLME